MAFIASFLYEALTNILYLDIYPPDIKSATHMHTDQYVLYPSSNELWQDM